MLAFVVLVAFSLYQFWEQQWLSATALLQKASPESLRAASKRTGERVTLAAHKEKKNIEWSYLKAAYI